MKTFSKKAKGKRGELARQIDEEMVRNDIWHGIEAVATARDLTMTQAHDIVCKRGLTGIAAADRFQARHATKSKPLFKNHKKS